MEQHNLSYIHPDAKIADNVKIGPFVTIEADVEIGEGTEIHSGAVILNGSRIGRNCRIHSSAVIGGVPQDLKFKGEKTLAIIGDNTVIREFATINRGTASKGKTVIGNNCLIMAYCHVAHDCYLHNNIIMSNACQIAGEVEIEDYAVIGGGTLVHQFTHIGQHIMLQGGSHVNKDIPPYAMVGREPISYIGINVVGLRRRGFTPEQLGRIQETYRYIYFSDLHNSEAINRILEETQPSAERDLIVDFIRTSARGIVRAVN
ncbi:MAG: acyl-ACP--UDP-N-acetylglucosamine O-acyltransferase [Bacteroidales bacterium]|nr:acyl-ACP--UDP-N-acetylglucosamine O-acyltransferase [Bacteroidales bacterium]